MPASSRVGGGALTQAEPRRRDDAEEGEGAVPGILEVMLLVGGDVDEAPRPHLGLAALPARLSPSGQDVDFVLPGMGVVRRCAPRRDLEMAHRERRRADVVPHQHPDGDSAGAGLRDALSFDLVPLGGMHGESSPDLETESFSPWYPIADVSGTGGTGGPGGPPFYARSFRTASMLTTWASRMSAKN